MSDTITVSFALERAAGNLDKATKEMYHASEDLEEAEEDWEGKWDEVAEELRKDLRELGSTRDPSEHAIVSATRKRYPDEYRAWKQAKHRLKRAEQASHNRRSQASAYQTMFNNLGAEAKVQDHLAQREPELVE